MANLPRILCGVFCHERPRRSAGSARLRRLLDLQQFKNRRRRYQPGPSPTRRVTATGHLNGPVAFFNPANPGRISVPGPRQRGGVAQTTRKRVTSTNARATSGVDEQSITEFEEDLKGPIQVLEQAVVGDLLPASGARGRDTIGSRRNQNARGSHGSGIVPHRPVTLRVSLS